MELPLCKCGCGCLIIWESELNNKQTVNKIKEFCERRNIK